MDNLFIGGP